MRRTWLLAVVALVLAACGTQAGEQEEGGNAAGSDGVATLEDGNDTDSGSSATNEPVDVEEAMMAFAECMQDLGVDAEVTVGPDGNPGIVMQRGEGDGPGGFQLADQCRHHLEGAVSEFQATDQTELMDQVLEFVGCLREQGVDMPDPDTTGGGFMFQPPQNVTQAEFMAAIEACDEFRPQGGGMAMGGGGN